jgi:hypothetical protein
MDNFYKSIYEMKQSITLLSKQEVCLRNKYDTVSFKLNV